MPQGAGILRLVLACCTIDQCENQYFSLLKLALRENNLLYIPRLEIKTFIHKSSGSSRTKSEKNIKEILKNTKEIL